MQQGYRIGTCSIVVNCVNAIFSWNGIRSCFLLFSGKGVVYKLERVHTRQLPKGVWGRSVWGQAVIFASLIIFKCKVKYRGIQLTNPWPKGFHDFYNSNLWPSSSNFRPAILRDGSSDSESQAVQYKAYFYIAFMLFWHTLFFRKFYFAVFHSLLQNPAMH